MFSIRARTCIVVTLLMSSAVSLAITSAGCRPGRVGRMYAAEQRRERAMQERMIKEMRIEVVPLTAAQTADLEKHRAEFFKLCDRYGETQETFDLAVFDRLLKARERDPEVMTRPKDEKVANALWAALGDTMLGHSNLRWITIKGYESDVEAVFLADQAGDTIINPHYYTEQWTTAKKAEGVRELLSEIDKACKRKKTGKIVEQVVFPSE
jgi:hypothetical protein